jgi:hypothetical protein
MANTTPSPTIEVRATVILRIPNLDTNEITALYQELAKIKAIFGGEFDVTTTPQPPEKP